MTGSRNGRIRLEHTNEKTIEGLRLKYHEVYPDATKY